MGDFARPLLRGSARAARLGGMACTEGVSDDAFICSPARADDQLLSRACARLGHDSGSSFSRLVISSDADRDAAGVFFLPPLSSAGLGTRLEGGWVVRLCVVEGTVLSEDSAAFLGAACTSAPFSEAAAVA